MMLNIFLTYTFALIWSEVFTFHSMVFKIFTFNSTSVFFLSSREELEGKHTHTHEHTHERTRTCTHFRKLEFGNFIAK